MTGNRTERLEQATRHIARMFAGDMSEQEALAIRRWRNADPANETEFLKGLALLGDVEARVEEISAIEGPGSDNSGGVTGEVPLPLAPADDSRARRWAILGAAAGIVLASLVGVILRNDLFLHVAGNSPSRVAMDRYITRVGEQKVLTLKDGSKVTLNTGSELLVNLTEQERWVRLERGEAFFEVAGDPSRPFNVYLNNYSVSVLGTAFNILKVPRGFTLAVVAGVVSLRDRDEALQPNAPLLVDVGLTDSGPGNDRAPLRLRMDGQRRIAAGTVVDFFEVDDTARVYRNGDLKKHYDWTDGRLYFEAENFSDVVMKLNRYIGKKILIEEPSIMGLKIYSVVDVKEIHQALSDFERTLPVEFIHYQDHISVVSAKNKK